MITKNYPITHKPTDPMGAIIIDGKIYLSHEDLLNWMKSHNVEPEAAKVFQLELVKQLTMLNILNRK